MIVRILSKLLMLIFGGAWLRWDARRDERNDIVNRAKEADREKADQIRSRVDDARRAGRVRDPDDTRGFRD